MLNIFRIFITLCLSVSTVTKAQSLKTYDISGNNVSQLVSSMKANSPNGYWANAYNQWHYSYRFTNSAGVFMLSNLEITRTVEVTMPNWRGYSFASKCRQRNWDSMYRSLRNHEDNHVRLANPVEGLLREAIMAIEPTDSMSSLEAAVKHAAQKVFDDNKLIQDKYDLETEHGKSDPIDPVLLKACL